MSNTAPNGLTRTLLSARGATGASLTYTPQSVYHSVQVTGTFVGTVAIEASLDGTNFVAVGTAITVPGIQSIVGAYKALRLNVTAFTSGTITATSYE